MKPFKASATSATSLISCHSRAWLSASTKISRNYNYHHQAQSFSRFAVAESLKRYLSYRARPSALSPCSTGFCISLSLFPPLTVRYTSSRAKSSTFSPSPQITRIGPTRTSQTENYNQLINALDITLPPSLHIPERKASQTSISYLYSQGRAYLNFFKSGLKNIWTMRKIAREIMTKLKQSNPQHMSLPLITRAEFQLVHRSEAAIANIIPFSLFIAVFAEFSPLLLVFITSIVPEPCQLPSVQTKIEKKFNERKFKSFIRYKEYIENTERGREERRMLQAISAGAGAASTSPAQQRGPRSNSSHSLLTRLSTPTLHHASTSIKAHPALLDRLTYIPLLSSIVSFIMTRNYFIKRIQKRLRYLRTDDALLLRDGSIEELSPQELKRAAAERGYLAESSLGVSDGMRLKQMKEWLAGSTLGRMGGAEGENALLRLILGG